MAQAKDNSQALTVRSSGSLDASDQRREGQQMGAQIRTFAQHRGMMKRDEFYKPGGSKEVPNARALQKMANAQHISSEVTRIDWKNESSFKTAIATAYVRAWVGPRTRPRQEQTDAMSMNMAAIVQKYIVKKLSGAYGKKADWTDADVLIDEATGRLWPVTKRNQLAMLSFLSDQYSFLDRLAVTKCQARVFDKMLRPDADVHFGDGDDGTYTEPHETAPASPGSGTGSPPPPAPEDLGGDPPPAAGPQEDTSPDPPAAAPPGAQVIDAEAAAMIMAEEEEGVSFPPTEAQVADHGKKIDAHATQAAKAGAATAAEAELSERSASLVRSIESAAGSKKSLDGLAQSLTAAKKDLPAGEHGRVMQVFWKIYREAK